MLSTTSIKKKGPSRNGKFYKLCLWMVVMTGSAGAATTSIIGFETAEGYTAGSAPISPWTFGPYTSNSVVTNAVHYTGSQSLGIAGNIAYASHPSVPAVGQAGSMSVDVRPAAYQFNFYTQGGAMIHNQGGGRNIHALFSVGSTGVPGQRTIRLDAGTAATYVANWIPDTWYNITFDFTATDVTMSVIGTNVNLSRTVTRVDTAGNVFGLVGADDNTTYYDNFTTTRVPEPTTLTLIGLGGLALLRRRL